MPFGLTNNLIVFMDLINKVFPDCLNKFIMVFIDKVIVYSKSREVDKKHMWLVLQRLNDSLIMLNFQNMSSSWIGLPF